jgi:hypothetical protein
MGFSAPKVQGPSKADRAAQAAALKESADAKAEAEAETARLQKEKLAGQNEILADNKSRRKRSASRFALTLTDLNDTLG